MSDEQPEIVKGWKLIGFGDDAVAEGQDGRWYDLEILGDVVFVVHEYGESVAIPKHVFTRFAERMNHLDANAENDRKLGAAVRAAILVHLTNSKETYSTKYTDELPVRLQMNGPHLSTDVMQAIASALRNEAAK